MDEFLRDSRQCGHCQAHMAFEIMKTASEEIRSLVVKAYTSGVASREQLAEIFGYTSDSIGRWIRESRKTQRLAPLPKGHRHSLFNAEEQGTLVEFIEKNPEATLNEIREYFQKPCSLPALHNIISKLGFICQKDAQGKRTRTRICAKEPEKAAHFRRGQARCDSCGA